MEMMICIILLGILIFILILTPWLSLTSLRELKDLKRIGEELEKIRKLLESDGDNRND